MKENSRKPFVADKPLRCLLVTSKDEGEADKILNKELPASYKNDYSYKLEILKNNFAFNLLFSYTLKTDQKDIDEENYFATLRYLISEARDCGIEYVIEKNPLKS